jgi:hypothetical protein
MSSSVRPSKNDMICNHEVLRNGYWTGRFCSAPAKWLVGEHKVCGVHKNLILRQGWITEATPLEG